VLLSVDLREVLGHLVSCKGLETDGDKTRLIEEWPVATSLKQLRGYLGLAGYYRRFVKDFSKKAAPLNDLLKKQPFPVDAGLSVCI